MKRNYRNYRDVLVLMLYIVFTFLFNWSILLGKNGMKWDIMGGYYPLCMSSADMLRHAKLPLWNAALRFGCPTYSMLGTPYWYPSTLFFEIATGYSLICVALEYCLHIILACYGMFLLAKSHLKEPETIQAYVAAVIVGGFYGYSGLFISNAQHIMIIVSAAWLPYIFFLVKKYLERKEKVFLMGAALCMGLSILGGYPEIWVATFIILIPYFLMHTRGNSVKAKIFKAAAAYIIFGIESAAVAAISLIPFMMASKYINRLGGGVYVSSYKSRMLLSTVLPHYTHMSAEAGEPMDISMISTYMGLLTIIVFCITLIKINKYRWQYFLLAVFSFLMMLGNNAFLHPVFQRFFPLFDTLRFPSLWRCIFTVFLLLLTAEALEDILSQRKKIERFAIVCAGVFLLFLLLYIAAANLPDDLEKVNIFKLRRDFQLDLYVCLFYIMLLGIIIFVWKIRNQNIVWLLILGMAADIFVGQYYLYPMTATSLNQWDLGELTENQTGIKEWYENDKNRPHSIDYSNAERSRNEKDSLDSYSIIMEHTLGEEGYLSVLLDYIQTYTASAHCKLSADVPEIYMTNDVVSYDDVDYNEWLEDEEVSPYQIFVEEKATDHADDGVLEADISTEHFYGGDILLNISQNIDGYLVIQQSYYPGWKAYVDGKKTDIEKINGAFIGVHLEAGEHMVQLVFRPLDFYVGAAITLGYFILFGILLAQYLRRKNRKDIVNIRSIAEQKGMNII